jgi:hypothetical protein
MDNNNLSVDQTNYLSYIDMIIITIKDRNINYSLIDNFLGLTNTNKDNIRLRLKAIDIDQLKLLLFILKNLEK